jgi:hypothetical protein
VWKSCLKEIEWTPQNINQFKEIVNNINLNQLVVVVHLKIVIRVSQGQNSSTKNS